jgi:hypothetical protein
MSEGVLHRQLPTRQSSLVIKGREAEKRNSRPFLFSRYVSTYHNREQNHEKREYGSELICPLQ